MKLKFFLDNSGKKQYTLKNEILNKKTNDAHYKFIKLRDAPPSDINIVRKN